MLCPGELTIRVELKYCEFCGGLWLRPEGSVSPYCGSCRPKIQELTDDPLRLRVGRPSRAKLPVLEACVQPHSEAPVWVEVAEVCA